jgi:hypothetical protein
VHPPRRGPALDGSSSSGTSLIEIWTEELVEGDIVEVSFVLCEPVEVDGGLRVHNMSLLGLVILKRGSAKSLSLSIAIQVT